MCNTKKLKEISRNDLTADDQEIMIISPDPPPESPPYLDPDVERISLPEARRSRTKRGGRNERLKISRTVVSDAIVKTFGRYSGGQVHLSDKYFRGYSLSELAYFLGRDPTDSMAFETEDRDCDDFTQIASGAVNKSMKGIAFGSIWYGGYRDRRPWSHAANIFYDYKSDQIYLIEPQTDEAYKWKKGWRLQVIML